MDIIIDIEQRRIRLKLKKQELAERAGVLPEMYSYLLRQGRKGIELPAKCLEKVLSALNKEEHAA